MFWLAYYRHSRLYRESLKTKDKTTAKYLQAKKDQELAEGKYITLDSLALTVLEEYRLAYEHQKGKRTHTEDVARIRKFLEWAHIQKIGEVNEKKLQDYFNNRIQGKLEPNTVNRIMASMKTWLNFAVRRQYIKENPMKGIKMLRLPENPPRFLTKDEIEKVLKVAEKTDIYPAVATAIYTGMRKSELFTLEWIDIDFTRGTITVRNKEGFTTKSKKFRVIPLHPALKAILDRIKLKDGHCFDIINQRRIFDRIMRKAEIDDLGWHSLRHTFASQMIMSGADLVTVSKLLGHSDIKTTMIYSHLTGDHIRQAVGKLSF